ncbi:hypothetical protein [Curtobacterium sp. RRHDQ10]|uniref:hypothetical protein n=1 Tax=Curtobacterium phyllosphaerae TaxID=3413379 RepID=UPI003BF2A9F8
MTPGAADAVLVARTVERVAALTRGGIDARRAWLVVAERTPGLKGVASAVAGGAGVADALGARPADALGAGPADVPGDGVVHALGTGGTDAAWCDVARAWRVAERTGAPSAVTLDAVAAALRDRAAAHRAVESALAGPRASGRVVLALPAVGVLFGLLWGGESLRFLLGSIGGWGCLLVAAALVVAARTWTTRLVARATPTGGVPGLALELWAVALSGGSPRSTAEHVVEDALAGRPVPPAERALLGETLDLADAVGIPAASLLRSAADDLRRDEAAEHVAEAERLGVRLVLPLGVCLLPAFVLVGIVPVVAGIFSSTVGAVLG